MKKTHEQKFNDMLNEGFSVKTLSKMSESQISGLHKRIVSEQTMVSKTDTATQEKLQREKKPYEVYEGKKKTDKKKNPWAICTSVMGKEFGDDLCTLSGASSHDIAEAGIRALQTEADKLM